MFAAEKFLEMGVRAAKGTVTPMLLYTLHDDVTGKAEVRAAVTTNFALQLNRPVALVMVTKAPLGEVQATFTNCLSESPLSFSAIREKAYIVPTDMVLGAMVKVLLSALRVVLMPHSDPKLVSDSISQCHCSNSVRYSAVSSAMCSNICKLYVYIGERKFAML